MTRTRIASLTAPLLIALVVAGFAGAANAGCVNGAIVGGIAGHLVGHGALGAAAGCAYGVHEEHKTQREQTDEGRSSSQQRNSNGY
jgi:hypothetical protein